MSGRHPWLGLAGWLALVFLVAWLGGLFTRTSVAGWYPMLRKPAWNPPAWVFGPVWSVLYLMMGVAVWLVWRRAGFAGAPWALGMFLAQLALNLAWSWFFFGLRNPLAGLVDIVFMIVFIGITIVSFFRVSSVAGWLMVPYLLWVVYASTLNFAIWRMNG